MEKQPNMLDYHTLPFFVGVIEGSCQNKCTAEGCFNYIVSWIWQRLDAVATALNYKISMLISHSWPKVKISYRTIPGMELL